HPPEGCRVVGAVDAGRDDHHALQTKRAVQRRHLLGQRRLRRIDASRKERKFLRVAVDVGVAVAGAGRHVEIHRRRRLRGLGKTGSKVHGRSGGNRSDQDIASRQHGFSFGGILSVASRFRYIVSPQTEGGFMQHVARAASDGCTILLAGNFTHAINPWLYKNLSWDPHRDFTPITEVALMSIIVCVTPERGIRSMKELIARVRSEPGKWFYASPGNGTSQHLAGAELNRITGTDMQH